MTNYQRLEFLGDSVLDFFITSKLYDIFPRNSSSFSVDLLEASEGRLSFLKACVVNNTVLAIFGHHLNLQEFVIMAENQLQSTKEKTFADIFEALIGKLCCVKIE